jgi:hypothetical protein
MVWTNIFACLIAIVAAVASPAGDFALNFKLLLTSVPLLWDVCVFSAASAVGLIVLLNTIASFVRLHLPPPFRPEQTDLFSRLLAGSAHVEHDHDDPPVPLDPHQRWTLRQHPLGLPHRLDWRVLVIFPPFSLPILNLTPSKSQGCFRHLDQDQQDVRPTQGA